MAITTRVKKLVRRSISLPPEIDTKVQSLASHQHRSANRVIENLIETGLEAKEAKSAASSSSPSACVRRPTRPSLNKSRTS